MEANNENVAENNEDVKENKEELFEERENELEKPATICIWPIHQGRPSCPKCGIDIRTDKEDNRCNHSIISHTIIPNLARNGFLWLNSHNRHKFIRYGLETLGIHHSESKEDIERKIEGINILNFIISGLAEGRPIFLYQKDWDIVNTFFEGQTNF
jgi:hypothetical protein